MKKIIPLLLFIIVVLAACGSNGIDNGVFTFDGQDFHETYEEESNQSPPDGLTISDTTLLIESADKEEVAHFLDTANHLVDDDKLDKITNTIQDKGIDDYMETESDNLLVTVRNEGDGYSSQVIVKTHE